MIETVVRIAFSLLVVLGLMWAMARLAKRPLGRRTGSALAVLALTLTPWPGAPAQGGGVARLGATDAAPMRGGLDMLHDVEMEVSAELGRTRMSVRELLSLIPGAIVELDRAAGSPADLLVNGRLIARGEVVVVDGDFGVRISEITEDGRGRR